MNQQHLLEYYKSIIPPPPPPPEETMGFYSNRKNYKYVVYLAIQGYQSAYGRLTIYKNFSLIHSMEIYLLDISRDLDLSKPYLAMKLNIVEKNKPIYEILQNGDQTGKGIVSRINNEKPLPDFVVFKRIYSEKEEKMEEDKTFIYDSDDDDDDSDDEHLIEYKLCILQ